MAQVPVPWERPRTVGVPQPKNGYRIAPTRHSSNPGDNPRAAQTASGGLALRAEGGRAPGQADRRDGSAARAAGQARAPVNPKETPETATVPIPSTVVPKGGAPEGEGLRQHLGDGGRKAIRGRGVQVRPAARRV